jgi:signal transduction histidine kinase
MIARLGLRALHGSSVDQTLAEALLALRVALRADYAEVLELVPDQESFVFRCVSGWPSALTGTTRVSARPTTVPGHAVVASEPIVIHDLTADSRFDLLSLEHRYGIRSGVSIVIYAGHTTFGVLGAHFRERRQISDEDVHFQQSIANLLSAAVQRHAADREREQMLISTAAAREAAERAERAQSALVAILGHELRTPLSAIAGYADLLALEVHGPINEAQRRDLSRIRHSHEYLINLIDNVLTFLKLGSCHVLYDMEDLEVADVFATTAELIEPLMSARQLTYEQNPPPRRTRVHADRTKIHQILLNLLSNATKFTDPGGLVRLDCTIGNGRIDIHVHDSGCGIPADQLQRIFEPFVRGETARAHSTEGTGLGLAISRDFARAMGGTLTVRSTLGEGSTFTLSMPRREP